MCAFSSVCIDDNLATGKAGVAVRATNDKLASGIYVESNLLEVEESLCLLVLNAGNDAWQKYLLYVFCDAFLHLLGDAAWRKTDLVYFSDDHLCRGALIAFLQTGVRIPEDIRLATWANRGNVPVYAKDLTRLEINPVADAAKVADACVATLSGGKPVKGVRLDTVFEHGETI